MSRSPSTPLDVQVAMKTDIGRKRKQNQDAIGHAAPPDADLAARLGQIFVLADGVGGLSGGDLASQYAVSTIISSYYDQEEGEPPERLARAIAEANNMIFAESQGQERPTIMATTVVAAVLREDELIVGSVGDSPAYLMRDAEVRQLTIDHTAEVLERETTAAENADPAARKLARALGSLPSVKVDIISGRVRPGDHIVLCSDGLTRYVSPREIEQTVATLTPERAVDALIETANDRGGADNVSMIVLRLGEREETAAPVVEAAATAPPLMESAPAEEESAPAPSLTPPPPITPRREPPVIDAPADEPPAETAWRVLLDIARGNALVTAAGLTIALVAFVAIMLAIAGLGGGGPEPTPTVNPAGMTQEAATAAAFLAATRQANAQATQAILEMTESAELATIAVLTLTPPPNSGPELETGMWFTVTQGDDVPAFEDASIDADEATELVSGSNYRVSDVDREATNGYWYFVVDNLGQEMRWVNGPSLHQRVLVVDESGNPLPDDQQPLDLPPGVMTPTRPAPIETPDLTTGTPDALDETPQTGTPGTPEPAETTATIEPTEPVIGYGVETWTDGDAVLTRQELQLCETPIVTTCGAGLASASEQGVIVDGPTASGEHWWWKVEFPDGRTGWIAQVLLGPA